MNQTVVINDEYQKLCRRLTADEYKQLEANIVRDGCREAISTWKGILIDGHHRYEICCEHKLPFRVDKMDFEDDEECKLWIIGNQLGRRNLSDLDRVALLESKRPILEKQAKERMKAGRPKEGMVNLPEVNEPPVRDQLAKEAGISGKTYEALRKVNKEGTDELKQAVRDKSISASAGSKIAKLSAEEQKIQIESQKKESDKPRFRFPPEAMNLAYAAITTLERISDQDKSKNEALDYVIDWCENHKQSKKGKQK